MSSSTPRSVIPPAWAHQGCCPVCQAPRLSVRQTLGAPDQMVCAQCGSAFELEDGGPRLALTQGPPAVASANGGTTRIWLTISELHALLQGPPAAGAPATVLASPSQSPAVTGLQPPSSSEAPASAAPGAPADLSVGLAHCTEAELMKRAESLLALGNSPLQIQVALVQSGVAPGLVQTVVEAMGQLARQKRQQQVRWTWLLTGLMMACLLIWIGGGWAVWRQTTGGAPSATSQPTNGLPTPTGVAGFFLSLPTSVYQTEPPPTPAAEGGRQIDRCPTSSYEASSLFGGQAGDWTYKADAGGWLMTTITPKTIYVPEGMLAGYLQFGPGEPSLNQVDGPARIHNVNFIAITCPE